MLQICNQIVCLSAGWHNRFQGMVGKYHPSFYHLLREFRKEQHDTAVMVRELRLGRSVKVPQKRKYAALNRRLRLVAEEYQQYRDDEDVLSYLRRCGHNIVL